MTTRRRMDMVNHIDWQKSRKMRKPKSFWKIIDETPFQDEAFEMKKEYEEDDATYEYKIKMVYGKIRDPNRPMFQILARKKRF